MSHLAEGTLQAYLDENLEADERAAAGRHLALCAECAGQLAELRSAGVVFSSAVRALDADSAVPGDLALVRRLRTRATVLSFPRRFATRSLARAAVLLLVFAAAASATFPGSPVRRWIERTFTDSTEEAAPAADRPASVAGRPAPETARPDAPAAPVSGVSVRPVNGRVDVVLVNSGASVRVVLVDGDRAVVLASGPAADANFLTAPGRIQITGGPSGELRIELPRRVDRLVVTRSGEPLFARTAGAVTAGGPAQVADGEFLFPPAGAR